MTKLYLAIGHGRKSDGTYDPGAVSGGLVENVLAARVTAVADAAFARSGLTVTAEEAGGDHDPNFSGSIARANAGGYNRACEIHFNAGGGHGVEVIVGGNHATEENRWAKAVLDSLVQALGLPSRGVKTRNDLAFVTKCNMPAILVEVAFVDGDHAVIAADVEDFCEKAGEAIARGTLAYLGAPAYKPPAPPSTYAYDVKDAYGNPFGSYTDPLNVDVAWREAVKVGGVANITRKVI